MPLFQYQCADCGRDQEILVRGNESPVCLACRSALLKKQISRPAALIGGSAAPMGCGAESCCRIDGGSCMN